MKRKAFSCQMVGQHRQQKEKKMMRNAISLTLKSNAIFEHLTPLPQN
jgi:hypothetical protein